MDGWDHSLKNWGYGHLFEQFNRSFFWGYLDNSCYESVTVFSPIPYKLFYNQCVFVTF